MKASLPIVTDYQKSIVFGYVLGDGYLYENGRLQVEQGSDQEEFVCWLYNQLGNVVSGEVKAVPKTQSVTKKQSYARRFYTKTVFQDFVSLFYIPGIERRKILPKNFEQFLDATVLAIWFMCDGTKYLSGKKGAYINATSFSEQEHSQIQQALKNVFGLTITIHKAGFSQSGNRQYNFYVTAGSYDKFYGIVYPIVSQVPSMLYKLYPLDQK